MRATTWLLCASLAMATLFHGEAQAQGSTFCNDFCRHWMGLDRPSRPSPPSPVPVAEPAAAPLSIGPPVAGADGTTPVVAPRKRRKIPHGDRVPEPKSVSEPTDTVTDSPAVEDPKPARPRKAARPARVPRPVPALATQTPAVAPLAPPPPPVAPPPAVIAVPLPVPPPAAPPPRAVTTSPPDPLPDHAAASSMDTAPLVFLPQDRDRIIARSKREQREAMPGGAAALDELDPRF